MTETTVEPSGASINAADPDPAGDNQADWETSGRLEANPEGSSARVSADGRVVLRAVRNNEQGETK